MSRCSGEGVVVARAATLRHRSSRSPRGQKNPSHWPLARPPRGHNSRPSRRINQHRSTSTVATRINPACPLLVPDTIPPAPNHLGKGCTSRGRPLQATQPSSAAQSSPAGHTEVGTTSRHHVIGRLHGRLSRPEFQARNPAAPVYNRIDDRGTVRAGRVPLAGRGKP